MPITTERPSGPQDVADGADKERRSRWWRTVMGEYPTGVSIITALDREGRAQGMVVGTFSSVSMDPPLISYMPMRSSRTYGAIADADRFRVSVLGAGHEELCRSFVTDPERRFTVGNWQRDRHGVPYLLDSVVWFDCKRAATVPAGDHDIVLGEVEELGYGDGTPGMPLLFLKGGYGSFTMPRLEFQGSHLGIQLRAARQMREEVEDLAAELGALVTLCSLAKDTVVVLAAANLQARGPQLPSVGATFPFAAPMGVVFAAWGSKARRDAWRRDGQTLGFSDDDLLSAMVERVRERGYAVSVGPTMSEQFERIVDNPKRGDSELQGLWADISRDYARIGGNADWQEHVSSIQVPVFDHAGEATLALAISRLPQGLSQYELDRIADRANAVGRRLTAVLTEQAP